MPVATAQKELLGLVRVPAKIALMFAQFRFGLRAKTSVSAVTRQIKLAGKAITRCQVECLCGLHKEKSVAQRLLQPLSLVKMQSTRRQHGPLPLVLTLGHGSHNPFLAP